MTVFFWILAAVAVLGMWMAGIDSEGSTATIWCGLALIGAFLLALALLVAAGS